MSEDIAEMSVPAELRDQSEAQVIEFRR